MNPKVAALVVVRIVKRIARTVLKKGTGSSDPPRPP